MAFNVDTYGRGNASGICARNASVSIVNVYDAGEADAYMREMSSSKAYL